MFIRPSLVSFIPCKPTLLTEPNEPIFPPLSLPRERSAEDVPEVDFDDRPQGFASFIAGDCGITGLLWMLGDTARRLKELGSNSSSLILLCAFREVSVTTLGLESRVVVDVPGSQWFFPGSCMGVNVEGGVSIMVSSPGWEEFRTDGGGVWFRLSKEFQNSTPAEFLTACCLKLSSVPWPGAPSAGDFILSASEACGKDGCREGEACKPGSLSRT